LFAERLRVGGGEGELEYCMESVERTQREKGEFDIAKHSLLRIYCYIRNQRLGATKDG
jgi:hypothetical protein